MFRDALPFLFGTCRLLGSARIDSNGVVETWSASSSTSRTVDDFLVHEREVQILERDITYRIIRVESSRGSGAIVVLERTSGGWRVLLPSIEFPKLFCRYPIRTSGFVPTSVILDAAFDLDQERRTILFAKPRSRELLHDALSAITPLIRIGESEGWELRHRLLRLEPVAETYQSDDADLAWLNGELAAVAGALAVMNVVQTPAGFGPAILTDQDWCADFIVPRLSDRSATDETTVERMWDLVADAEEFYPPIHELAEDWSAIAAGWSRLGLQLSMVSIDRLAASVRDGATTLDQLHVRCEPREWLARFIDRAGEAWTNRAGGEKSLFEGLMPDQRGVLTSGAALFRSKELPDELKRAAVDVGIDVAQLLVDDELVRRLDQPELASGRRLLQDLVERELTQGELLRRCVDHLRTIMPDGQSVEGADQTIAGTIRLPPSCGTSGGSVVATKLEICPY
jgi:hypothetical protein